MLIRVSQDHTLLIIEGFDLVHILKCFVERFQLNFDVRFNTVQLIIIDMILMTQGTGFEEFSGIRT